MRTILQVTPYYPPHLGGLERVVQHLAHELAPRHRVRVVTTTLGAGGSGRLATADGVTVRRHRALELAHTPLAPGLPGSLLRAPRSAVLHLHCAHALLPELVALTARLRGQRYLLHFHLDVDASGPLGRLLPLYKKHLFGRVLRGAAAVAVLTEAQGEFVRATYRVPAERIFVVPNGVGEEYFMAPRPASRPASRAEHGEPLRLLFVGRLGAQKNVARLLTALSLVREPVRLRVVGDGELRGQLVEQAARLGLGERVEFAGGLLGAELLDAYARADAFVLPSDKEGMPLAVLEAMAAALPVLATEVPGSAELVRGVGLLAAPEPAALAAAIDRLAGDAELRAQLAERSAETARRYSWAAVAERVEQIYDAVFGIATPTSTAPTGAAG
ncbi:glycosyltransferase involved in cell wall biosynthesis [Kitasatospora sp. GAS204A]|uniref:glycosyltransferase family 4 protein n=1 Tax=unclassified Kitasatospora TaxID=2633591 RepID=UPI0024758944|nr:glycosyltransferase family 4 protein [Kitasatospora sp. GAS204B]MDH6116438.1 glycosyltransferase involved in cell wall biosynthesis [Kitasatospora sp. GAS204B]